MEAEVAANIERLRQRGMPPPGGCASYIPKVNVVMPPKGE